MEPEQALSGARWTEPAGLAFRPTLWALPPPLLPSSCRVLTTLHAPPLPHSDQINLEAEQKPQTPSCRGTGSADTERRAEAAGGATCWASPLGRPWVEMMRVGLSAWTCELDEQLAHHGRQVLDDLLPVLLHTHGGAVAVRVGVHAAHDLRGSGVSRRPGPGPQGQTHHLYASSACAALGNMNRPQECKFAQRDLIKNSTTVRNPSSTYNQMRLNCISPEVAPGEPDSVQNSTKHVVFPKPGAQPTRDTPRLPPPAVRSVPRKAA